jgi:hypothetical protein
MAMKYLLQVGVTDQKQTQVEMAPIIAENPILGLELLDQARAILMEHGKRLAAAKITGIVAAPADALNRIGSMLPPNGDGR